jgi:inner membrane protein
MSLAKSINPLFAKCAIIGALVLGLLVPLGRVESLVSERSDMHRSAEQRVAQGWGSEQIIGGPILAIPIDTPVHDSRDDKRATMRREWRQLLPEALEVAAALAPNERHTGIYRVHAYSANIDMTARFSGEAVRKAFTVSEPSVVVWSAAKLLLPIRDLRGIREIAEISWNGRPLVVSPALDGVMSGVSAAIEVPPGVVPDSAFRLHATIAGTKDLSLLPFGRTTTARMQSSWPHPSFSGAFLPARYRLDQHGFDASWQVLEVNRDYPQSWDTGAVSRATLEGSAFGVALYAPVDIYQRNYRAIRYAVLFIAVTFMCLFLWEQVSKQRLHAMQYLLIGLALATFYLLLIALSEHMSFGLAYALAAGGQVAVLGVYLVGAMRARLAGLMAAAAIAGVYGALYVLVLSEDYALLLGALLLFAILAAILLVTRRLDWHRMTAEMPSASVS